MEVTKHTPEPTPPPPVTFDLRGLTHEEMNTIRQSLYQVGKGRGTIGVQHHAPTARRLHAELYKAMTGHDYD